jgi:hypothetical protein
LSNLSKIATVDTSVKVMLRRALERVHGGAGYQGASKSM